MAAPVAQGSLTPYAGLTFGRLRELALRSTFGSSDAAHASPDSSLPPASAQEIALVTEFVQEALVELQEVRELYWSLSEATVTAEESGVTAGTYPSVLLPADFGNAVKDGFFVGGTPVRVMTEGEWLRTRRPAAEGGGTYLTDVTGAAGPRTRMVLRIAPASQTSDTAVWRLAAWLYPLQTSAWSLEVNYRATAKNMTGDTWPVRLPTRMQRLVLLYCAARGAESNNNVKGAAERWALYNEALNQIEAVPPGMEQQTTMILDPPLEGY